MAPSPSSFDDAVRAAARDAAPDVPARLHAGIMGRLRAEWQHTDAAPRAPARLLPLWALAAAAALALWVSPADDPALLRPAAVQPPAPVALAVSLRLPCLCLPDGVPIAAAPAEYRALRNEVEDVLTSPLRIVDPLDVFRLGSRVPTSLPSFTP